jgi:cob(I)alamin adenosyltransferase
MTDVELLEKEMDRMNEKLPELRHFILPGGSNAISYCHIARCVCRRAERITVHLAEESTVDEKVNIYLNRLSDYLFTLARKIGQTSIKCLKINGYPAYEKITKKY